MSSDAYELNEGAPDVATYLSLREAGGLRKFSRAAAQAGLANTLFGVTVRLGDRTIGMGRVIGDGGCFFQLVDIVVTAQFRGVGLGRRIVAALVGHIETTADPSAIVTLIADVPANHLYERFGFNDVAPQSVGMARRAQKVT